MLGTLVAVTNQTIVSPAMPVIVAELGGIEHYSWIASSTLLAVAVSVPVVGKLSDIFGRRGFYIAGLVVFMLGSILAGMAQGFWWLVGARAVQGLGMGALQTLSQTIIGDIVSPRERGRYMGYLGGVFGLASIAGPLAGGWITDAFSWRWLFYINLPIGVAALVFIVTFLHLSHVPRQRSIDYVGFVTLGLSSRSYRYVRRRSPTKMPASKSSTSQTGAPQTERMPPTVVTKGENHEHRP